MPLGRRTDYGEARYAGVEVEASADVERDLDVRCRDAMRMPHVRRRLRQPARSCRAVLRAALHDSSSCCVPALRIALWAVIACAACANM
jgi:hypothetical protein